MIPEPLIEKLQVKVGSVQIKIGNEHVDADVSLQSKEEKNHPESLVNYFTKKISPLIPNFYASRLAEYLGISIAETEFYRKFFRKKMIKKYF
jgi:hypothetical protein